MPDMAVSRKFLQIFNLVTGDREAGCSQQMICRCVSVCSEILSIDSLTISSALKSKCLTWL